MQLAEKQELVRLLNLYQADLLMDNDNNIREAAKHPDKKWEGTYKTGVKAQYEHARVIAAKLSARGSLKRFSRRSWEMKTRNDILAEYVRSRYPEIEKTFDFAAYSAGVALKEFGRCIKEAFGGTGKEVDDVCYSEH